MTSYTKHSSVRCQQRAVPPFIVELLLQYGRSIRRHGAEVYALDKHGRRELQKEIGNVVYRRISDLLDTYVVVSDDDNIITVGHRNRRIRQN